MAAVSRDLVQYEPGVHPEPSWRSDCSSSRAIVPMRHITAINPPRTQSRTISPNVSVREYHMKAVLIGFARYSEDSSLRSGKGLQHGIQYEKSRPSDPMVFTILARLEDLVIPIPRDIDRKQNKTSGRYSWRSIVQAAIECRELGGEFSIHRFCQK